MSEIRGREKREDVRETLDGLERAKKRNGRGKEERGERR